MLAPCRNRSRADATQDLFLRLQASESIVKKLDLSKRRVIGDAVSKQKVHRKDEEYGSHFVQEVSKGTYPPFPSRSGCSTITSSGQRP